MEQQSFIEQTWDWEIKVETEEQGRYLDIPFELPAATERLHVSYSYEGLGAGACTIDLGLRNGSCVRGWSGGARTEFFVEETEATPGYVSGGLQAGSWAVLLGVYRVPLAGCIVRGQVTVRRSSGSWLQGELHSHTVHSDGTYTLQEAIGIMKEVGCDFLAITDHNTISQNYEHPRDSGLVLIPGMELTTYFGHCNVLGAAQPIRDFRVSTKTDVADRLHEARRNGAVCILNHPFCDSCPWEWGMDVEAEAVEIWNGPWRKLNQLALEWWQEQLVAGRRIPAVGGSDVHRPHPYVKHACPSTWVYAGARTKEAILEGIASGRVYMSFAPHGPVLQLHCGQYSIGDTVPTTEAASVSVKLERLLPGDVVRFVTDKGQADERTVKEQSEIWSANWAPPRDERFMRVEVWRYFQKADAMCPALISNPIYFR